MSSKANTKEVLGQPHVITQIMIPEVTACDNMSVIDNDEAGILRTIGLRCKLLYLNAIHLTM